MVQEREPVSLEDILITEELFHRSLRTADLKAENDALRILSRQLVEQPQTMLKTLAAIAKDLCRAGTAGVSLIEITPRGEEIFRLVAIAGELEKYQQALLPRHFSPCGVCLERQAPQLYSYPGRYFTDLQQFEPLIVEGLVIPLIKNNRPLGTIWIVSHDPQRQFDAEDVRIMNSLADFTAAALHKKQMEETLQQREAEMSLVTNTVPVLISFVDSQQRYRFTNQTYEKWFGRSATEVYGKKLWEVLGETPYQMIRPYVEQALAGQQVTFESEIPYQDGGTRYVNATYIPRFNQEEKIIGFVALVSDISQQKQAELALRQSEERLRIAQQAAKAGVWNWDILNNQVTWSEEYYRLYGLDPVTVQPSYENWLASIAPPDRERANQSARAALKYQGYLNVEFRIAHPTKGERWLVAIGQTFCDTNRQPIRMTGIALDITERKQTEEALHQSEKRFETLVKNMPGMVYRYFPNAQAKDKFTYVSSGSCELFELEPEIILQDAKALWSLIHPDDFASLQKSVAAAVAHSADWQWEGRIFTTSGKLRWIQGRARMEETECGKVWDGLLLDITARKQAEEALVRSEAQLRLIIESAKDYAIFTLNMDLQITRWNSGAQRLLGYEENEILGRHGRIIFTPEDLEQGEVEREVQKALQEGRAENERWHVRKDGSRFWASGLMMPLRDEENQIQGLLKILQDKTVQRRADEQLHLLYETTSDLLATEQPLALMNALFSKLSIQLDLHFYYNFLIEQKDNRQKLQLKNYSGISEDVVAQIEWLDFGEHICGLVAQEQQQIVLDCQQIVIHPKAQFIRSLGITAYACQPLIARGRLLGTLSFGSRTRTSFTAEEIDLLQSACDQMAIAIERANLIASLQNQTKQLQQANRIKDEFLAVLSHELRSPLNPILGWSKLLQTASLDEATTKQALTTIERNAKLQAELIKDLLDISRILRGKLSLNVISVNLALTIKAAIETVRLAAKAKSIYLETKLDPQVGLVAGDPTRLQQVVWNLLSNAVKFTPPGGRVEVRLESHEFSVMSSQLKENSSTQNSTLKTQNSLKNSQSFAQITVKDTGKGISADFLPYVFDYFRQADSSTTRKFGGLGLGLAIAHYLVELHGGTIQADSPGEGRGATFTVRLPFMSTQPTVNKDPQLYKPVLDLSGVQILVVDDDADTRTFIAFVLKQAKAKVIAAASAEEALTVFQQSPPNILISDLGMPQMDGYMLMRQIRALTPEQGGQIPAIALTAYAGERDQQQVLAVGFHKHIPKPIEPEKLVREIVTLL
jgi:PAS domain S-box-containing protein